MGMEKYHKNIVFKISFEDMGKLLRDNFPEDISIQHKLCDVFISHPFNPIKIIEFYFYDEKDKEEDKNYEI